VFATVAESPQGRKYGLQLSVALVIEQFEAGGETFREADLDAIRRALEDAGVIFVGANNGPGVRLKG